MTLRANSSSIFYGLAFCASMLLIAGAVAAEEAPASAQPQTGDKALSGMSILGNQEAPKALVIVPWKSSQMGDTLGLSETLNDARKPVDKEVFMRELAYYEIRSN